MLEAASEANLTRFVFTSTTGTLAINARRPVSEDDAHNWTGGGPYITSRIAAEDLVMSYVRDKGLPAVAMCVSTTYALLARVSRGAFPFYFGYSSEVVGIDDAAHAMILAAERGRIGDRYIVSDRYMRTREVHEIAAEAVGLRAPRIKLPIPLMYAGAYINDLAARLLRRDLPFAVVGMRMAELMSPLDHSKAVRELDWKPEPVEESIRAAATFFSTQ